MATLAQTVLLSNGQRMPLVFLGTYKMKEEDTLFKALDAALGAGYRAFDTASVYRNEQFIGKALKKLLPKYGLQREDIFITSKLGPAQQGYEAALAACQRSLELLCTPYLDLFLIHWPGVQGKLQNDAENKAARLESWRGMQQAQQQGLARAIGVSNFKQEHLLQLMAAGPAPAVLQSELHPMLTQKEMLQFCAGHCIHFQAYSSLGTTAEHDTLLKHAIVQEIAQKANKSPAQVLLRWAVQQGISVLPKSSNPAHIGDNIRLFDWELDAASMKRLSHDMEAAHHFCWDPQNVQ